MNAWHRLVVHLVPDGPANSVQIWWNGRSLYAGSEAGIGAAPADAVQLGSEHDQQMGNIYIDDVIVNTGAGTPVPVPGPLPVPRPAPVQRLDDISGDWQSDLLAADRHGPVSSRRTHPE